jgi:hypothetical protein
VLLTCINSPLLVSLSPFSPNFNHHSTLPAHTLPHCGPHASLASSLARPHPPPLLPPAPFSELSSPAHGCFRHDRAAFSMPTEKGTLQSSHMRSKSRSQVYHHHGSAKLKHQQLDLLLQPNGETTDSPETDVEDSSPAEGGMRLWGGKALEAICQQNSAIVLLLASPQGKPTKARLSPSPAPLRSKIPDR